MVSCTETSYHRTVESLALEYNPDHSHLSSTLNGVNFEIGQTKLVTRVGAQDFALHEEGQSF